ncbi:MAG: BatA domain-containing protein, partial [Methylovirgula sp.]
MFGLPLAFTIPAVLVALAGLPVLYYLLRVTPPRPRRVPFPPLRLILDLRPREETAAFTPWWLLVLRLAIAALLIFAVAGPILNPLPAGGGGKAPLLVLLDDGWPAAPNWDQRLTAAAQWIAAAGRNGRTVAVTSPSEGGRQIMVSDSTQTLERLRAIKPQPYVSDRMALLPAIQNFMHQWPQADVVWIADGLARGNTRAFAEKLASLVPKVTLVTSDRSVYALAGPRNEGGAFDVRVLRSGPHGPAQGIVRALDRKGLSLGEARFDFAGPQAVNATEAKAQFNLPVELRNEIARFELLGQASTGAVTLLDERWKRRSVGIVSGETADRAMPLLAPSYYLKKALSPFADVHEARPGTLDPIAAMLDDHVAVLILADVGMVTGPDHARLKQFVEKGGLLLRFAGTRLAAASNDDLVPVRLRRGGRVLGGALSWETPKRLAPFGEHSPFFGLKVPNEVTVRRQVLAEPDAGLQAKTWAQLVDGTPLVTASRLGDGMMVLFHVTADTTWSNLPLSGLFVDMLRKIVALSSASAKAADQTTEAQAKPG